MSEILKFNEKDTALKLTLNGDESKIIEFDPGDVVFRKKFFEIKDSLIKKQQELDSKIKKIDLTKDSGVKQSFKLEEEFYDYIESLIDDLFKEGTAKMVCNGRKNVFVLANFIIALVPYFERFKKETEDKYLNKFKETGVL